MTFKYSPETRPLDGFTIKRAIQRGGFGEVYFALSDAGKEVALKLLQSNLDIELRGVSQCLNLKHPNLLTIFDVKQSASGEHWVVMEFMGGQTLDEIISAHPNGLPAAQVEQYLAGIAAGVSYLHEQGLVHRDLKPANIYVEHGHVKIGDVGLSKFISTSRRSGHTESVGTVYYMAPEIAHGRYGHEIDVYALGVILFEMLTGNVPFDGETTGEILMKQLTQVPDLLPLPTNMRPVLQRVLAKDPAQRTPSANALLREYREPSISVATEARPIVRVAPQDEDIPVAELSPNQPQRVPVTVLAPAAEVFEREPRKPQTPVIGMQQERPVARPPRLMSPEAALRAADDDAPTERWIVKHPLLFMVGLATAWFLIFPLSSLLSHQPVQPTWLMVLLAGSTLFWSFLIVRIITVGVRRAFLLAPLDARSSDRQRVEASERVQRLNDEYHRYRGPDERRVGWLDRLSEMTGSMVVSAICAAAVTTVLWGLQAFVKTPTQAAFFAIGTTLGCWAAIIPAKLWEGRAGTGVARRLTSMVFGAIGGLVLFGLDDYLKVGLDISCFRDIATTWSPSMNFSTRAAMACQGYATFFGGLLVTRRWWYRLDAFRMKRLSLWSVLGTSAVALIIGAVTRFPLEWAVMWGVSISAIAQLSSVWVPDRSRSGLNG